MAKGYIRRLEGLTRKAEMVVRPRIDEDVRLVLARVLHLSKEDTCAKELLKGLMRSAFQCIDGGKEDPREGYLALAQILTAVDDSDTNALAAWCLLGPNRDDEEAGGAVADGYTLFNALATDRDSRAPDGHADDIDQATGGAAARDDVETATRNGKELVSGFALTNPVASILDKDKMMVGNALVLRSEGLEGLKHDWGVYEGTSKMVEEVVEICGASRASGGNRGSGHVGLWVIE